MITCDDFSLQMSDFLEGELSDERSGLLNAHLESCDSCARIMANARTVAQTLKKLPKVATSEKFNDELHQRLTREASYKQSVWQSRLRHSVRSLRSKPLIATFAAAAAITLAVVLIDTYMQNGDNNDKVLFSPRIEIPPLPGSGQRAAALKSPLTTNPLQVGGFYFADSSSKAYRNPALKSILPENLKQSLRNQAKK